MVRFNSTDKEMSLKVVYVGCALGGKTTSLEKIHEHIAAEHRSRLVSLNTSNDRTLFFDLLPLELGQIGGYSVKLQLFTVPGQVQYTTTRRAVLAGVDSVVVVVDSSPDRAKENKEALTELVEHLKFHGLDIRNVPLVLQFNKRDLPDALPLEELNKRLNPRDWPVFESVAREGKGVIDAFLKASVLAADEIVRRHKFPPSFGERLISSLERQILQTAAAPESIPEHKDARAGQGSEPPAPEELEPKTAAPAPSEPMHLGPQPALSGPDVLRAVQEGVALAGRQHAGGGRQRVQTSSIDSTQGLKYEQLVEAAVEAQESLARVNVEMDRLKQKLVQRESQLADLGRLARWTIAQQKDNLVEELLKVFVQTIQAAGGAVLLPEPGGSKDMLIEGAISGFTSDPLNSLPCKGFSSLASGLYQRGFASVSPDPSGKPNPVDAHLMKWKIVSHIASPLECHGELVGLLTVYRTEPSAPFDKVEITLASAAASLVSYAVEATNKKGRMKISVR